MLNNGNNGQMETDASMLGPFWRMHAPSTPNGGSIVRSPTPGPALFVRAWFKDTDGAPIVGAEVDVWHSSTEGFYENQDPGQADMNLRGRFLTDHDGFISFRSVLPAGYPIPVDGPVGDLLRAQGRHNMRPAHLHFLVSKEGFKTLISQIYRQDDPVLTTDVQFGVTRRLIGNYARHEHEASPATDVTSPWYSLDHTFVMERGRALLPVAPIRGKAEGERPQIERLAARNTEK
jgi:catechol 1,2-dioxygenase